MDLSSLLSRKELTADQPLVEVTANQPFPTVKVAGKTLHSRQPRQEAANLTQSLLVNNPDVVMLFGFGLGYLAAALLNKKPELRVVVLEPSATVLASLHQVNQADPIWNDPRILWFHADDYDLAMRLVQTAQWQRPVFFALPAVGMAFSAAQTIVKAAIEQWVFRRDVNIRTLQRFGQLWVRNLLRNYRPIASAPAIDLALGRFGGFPALLIAGGPSLDSLIPHIKALHKRCLLIAVDTSLRSLLRVGVDPDFVVGADPQYWNTRHLDGCTASQAIVVSEPAVYARSLRVTQGPVLISGSLFPLGRWLESQVQPRATLGAGGSVATSAWDFARRLGVNAIYTAGLDLSFPGGQTHFHGSFFEEITHTASHRLRPAAHERFRYLHDGQAYLCSAEGGGTVYSDRRMDIYVHWFEQQVALHPQPKTWRLRAPHRQLRGIEVIGLDQLLELPDQRPNIDVVLDSLKTAMSLAAAKASEQGRQVRQSVVELDQTLADLEPKLASAITICQRLLQPIPPAETQSALAKLADVDTIIGASDNQRVIGFLLEDIIQELQRLATPADLAESVHRSMTLYSRLQGSIELHRQLFKRYILS
jgi:hypothetical protein